MDKEHSLLVLQAVRLGQHSPAGTGAGVPSGQTLRSMVHIIKAQLVAAKKRNRCN
jgi:hypothetical protein